MAKFRHPKERDDFSLADADDAIEDIAKALGMTDDEYLDLLSRDPREVARRLREGTETR